MFDTPVNLGLGLLTGLIFGFLLQKGRVAKFEVIVGQFLLRDWTVIKVMGTAVIVGAIGVYALVEFELASLHIKPLLFGGVLAGAVLFGVGMAVLGYCPGTSVAGCGEGRRDALAGVAGLLAGAIAFVWSYPMLQPLIKGLGDAGKITWPTFSDTSPWIWVAGLAALGGTAALLARRWHRDRPTTGRTVGMGAQPQL